jgi:hypothetical protein
VGSNALLVKGRAIINILVLKQLPYTIVFPLTSITYIWTLMISYFLLGEKIKGKNCRRRFDYHWLYFSCPVKQTLRLTQKQSFNPASIIYRIKTRYMVDCARGQTLIDQSQCFLITSSLFLTAPLRTQPIPHVNLLFEGQTQSLF